MIIDCHCHAGRGDGMTAPWDTDAPLERYLERARRAGIDRTVLFAAFHSDFAVANHEVARIVRSRPDRFYGFAFVDPVHDRGRIARMVRIAVRNYGFCGIKVHRYHGDMTREVCDVARQFRLPVLYDVMGKVSSIEMFASRFPDVPFIIPHLGSFKDDWRAHTAIIDQLVRYPNVFTDTSGVLRFDLLEEAVRRAGAHKMLFGSDGPWLHPGVELAKVRELRLSAEDERLVLGGNWLRITAKARARTQTVKPSRVRKLDPPPATRRAARGIDREASVEML